MKIKINSYTNNLISLKIVVFNKNNKTENIFALLFN